MVANSKNAPLLGLTNGTHMHTLSCALSTYIHSVGLQVIPFVHHMSEQIITAPSRHNNSYIYSTSERRHFVATEFLYPVLLFLGLAQKPAQFCAFQLQCTSCMREILLQGLAEVEPD